jgi:ATP-dependent Clp protease ATP-binding subunit ClpA
MEEKVYLRKKDEELEDVILARLKKEEDFRPRIREMLKYNMLTAKQVSQLVGMDISTVNNKLRNGKRNESGEFETELDECYPFINLYGRGPKFVKRNEKLDHLLRNGRQRS